MRFLLILIGLILLIFFGLPDVVLYSKSGFERWLPIVVILLGIPFLIYKTLAEFKIRKDIGLTISIGSVLLIGPLFGLWTESLSDKDLDKNGEIKIGVVSEKWYAKKHKSSNREWLYKAEFKVDNNIYHTYSYVDEDNIIKVGDTILIKYSKRNPENNKKMKTK
jgi:hypothetical protein